MLAIVRPDEWNFPLFVHVAGAMLMVAALVVVMVLGGVALRRGDGTAALSQLAFRGLLIGVLPAYIVMRAGAEWIASKAEWGEPTWIGIGYSTADGGLLLAIIATVLAWRAAKRGDAGPGGMGRAVVFLCGFLLLAYLVAIWAMTNKPD
jgi:hypothetical protein